MRGIRIFGGLLALTAVACWLIWSRPVYFTESTTVTQVDRNLTDQEVESPSLLRSEAGSPQDVHLEFALLVVSPSGDPVPEARVAVLGSEGAAQQYAKSDAMGLVSLDAAAIGLRLLIVADSHAPTLTEPLTAGQREVLLHSGEVVSGRMTFLGQTPADSLTLILDGDVRLVPFSEVLPEVLDSMGITPTRTGRMQAVTDREGRFRFSGLPAGWSGTLRWDSRWHFRSELEDWRPEAYLLQLDRPQEGVLLDLDPPLYVTGRIVQPDGITPLPAGEALLTADLVESDSGHYGSGGIGPDGDFRIPMRLPAGIAITNLKLSIRVKGAPIAAPATFMLDVTGSESIDLGVLVLPSGRSIHLEVRDASGQVPADARARAEWGLDWHGPPDERGIIGLPIEATESAALIKASGHYPVRVSIPQSGVPDPLSVILEKANEVVVRIQNAVGQPVVNASVSIMGSATLWGLQDWERSDWLRRSAGTRWKSADWVAQREWFYRPDAAGEVRLLGLDPMQSFTLAVFPDGGLATHLELIEAPPAGEILERIVTIESEYVLFQAQVVTADGVGIRPDRIEIATEYRESELILAAPDADEEGRFSASLCHPGTVSVTIRKKGFPDLCVDSFSVDSVGEHLFTLAEGRRVAVHVTTEAGEGVPAIVEIYYAGNQVGSKRCGADGIAVITAIPHEDCTTRVVYAGKEYLNALGSFEEETKFIVDSSGQLRIRCSAELEDAQSRGLLMLAVRPLAEGGAEVRQPLTREGFTSLPLVTGRYDLSLLELDLEAFARRLIREVRQIEILAGEITELLL